MLAGVPSALKLRGLHQGAVQVSEAQIDLTLAVEQHEDVLPDQLQGTTPAPEVEAPPT